MHTLLHDHTITHYHTFKSHHHILLHTTTPSHTPFHHYHTDICHLILPSMAIRASSIPVSLNTHNHYAHIHNRARPFARPLTLTPPLPSPVSTAPAYSDAACLGWFRNYVGEHNSPPLPPRITAGSLPFTFSPPSFCCRASFHSEPGKDEIEASGTMRLCEDLNVTPENVSCHAFLLSSVPVLTTVRGLPTPSPLRRC